MNKINFNRLANLTNPHQRKYKKVLCVCSAGLLRSPTAAVVLSQEPYNFNTRAAGLIEDFALIPVDDALLEWADEVVCMSSIQKENLEHRLLSSHVVTDRNKPVISLNIPDSYAYRDPELMQMIRTRYNEATGTPTGAAAEVLLEAVQPKSDDEKPDNDF